MDKISFYLTGLGIACTLHRWWFHTALPVYTTKLLRVLGWRWREVNFWPDDHDYKFWYRETWQEWFDKARTIPLLWRNGLSCPSCLSLHVSWLAFLLLWALTDRTPHDLMYLPACALSWPAGVMLTAMLYKLLTPLASVIKTSENFFTTGSRQTWGEMPEEEAASPSDALDAKVDKLIGGWAVGDDRTPPYDSPAEHLAEAVMIDNPLPPPPIDTVTPATAPPPDLMAAQTARLRKHGIGFKQGVDGRIEITSIPEAYKTAQGILVGAPCTFPGCKDLMDRYRAELATLGKDCPSCQKGTLDEKFISLITPLLASSHAVAPA
jgi:hypothetical protein